MGRKSKWELEQDKIKATRKKAIKNLTEHQLQAIKETHATLYRVLDSIRELEDVYLSDIKEMDGAMWKLRYEFNLEDKNNG